MRHSRPRSSRGSAMSLTIVVSVVLTGLAIALAWAASVHAHAAGQIPKIDASYYAAEAGMQHAIWRYKHDNQWRATPDAPLVGTIQAYDQVWTYSVTCTDAILDSQLLWRFDEADGSVATDATAWGYHGMIQGNATRDSAGRFGGCLRFNGIDGYVSTTGTPPEIAGDFSICLWVRTNVLDIDQRIAGNQSGVAGGFQLSIYDSCADLEIRNAANVPTTNRSVSGAKPLTLGAWHLIVGAYSSTEGTLKTYLNGEIDRTLSGVAADALALSNGDFVVGRQSGADIPYYFNGWIDDVRVFNRALTPAEVRALFYSAVDIRSTASSGPNSSFVNASCAIPTSTFTELPAITTGGDLTIKNFRINGNIEVRGNVKSTTGQSTVDGSLYYAGSIDTSHVNVKGKSQKVLPTDIYEPQVDMDALRAEASLVIEGDSSGQSFNAANLTGKRIIWIKGNLTNPDITVSGSFPHGAIIVVDGEIKVDTGLIAGSATFPVSFVSQGSFTHTNGNARLYGGVYTLGTFTHKNFDLFGPVYAKMGIVNTSILEVAFSSIVSPWFDDRINSHYFRTGPVVVSNYRGVGP